MFLLSNNRIQFLGKLLWIFQAYEENIPPFITIVADNISNFETSYSDLLRTKRFGGDLTKLQWTSEIT